MDFRFFTCFTFVLMCTTSFAYPLGLDNAIIGGSQVLMNFGDGFQQWGESNKVIIQLSSKISRIIIDSYVCFMF